VADNPTDIRGDELELLIRGQAFTGWESMSLARALDAVAAQFEVTVADRDPYPIRAGDEVSVRLAGTVLLTGYVDSVESSGGPTGREFTVQGRDRTADLVDCSAGLRPGEDPDELEDLTEWVGVTLIDLATELAAPFGVDVRALFTETQEPFDLFRRQVGESAWSAIERAARRRGVLVFSSGEGELLLDLPASGRASASLTEGEGGNVKGWTVSIDHRPRHSHYLARAQLPGSDAFNGTVPAEIEGRARDNGVSRFRPLLVLGEGAMTFDDADDRAAWEASVRAARSERLSVIVPGWRQVARTGPVWTVNQTAEVRILSAGIQSTLLVDSVQFLRSAEGTTTQLGLTRPDAYRAEPVIEDVEDFLGTDQ
jgi:prophage tail gpP-like protein